MRERQKKSLSFSFAMALFALMPSWARAATIDPGLAPIAATTVLGTDDIRIIVGRIIQVLLGVLGAVALVLIIYAGFLWMTAGGEEEKVERAKRILIQAVIGLGIVLASFALATFVISRLMGATGANGGPGGGPGDPPGPGIGQTQFSVSAIVPPDSKAANYEWPKNSQVRIVLRNGLPDPISAQSAVSVSANGVPVSGTASVKGNVIVFTPSAKCAENDAYSCLPGNSTVAVTVAPTLASSAGKPIYCGLCSASFLTNDLIDAENPRVSIVSPSNGASVPSGSFVPVIANATDDAGIATVEFFANNESLGTVGAEPWQADWDTTGIPTGNDVGLKGAAVDVAGNSALSPTVTVTVRPAHCFNTVQDGGETGLNCGDGCGRCPGDSCTDNSQCASGLCQEGKCVNRPRIDAVRPNSGGPGTLTTISGASFGAAPGHVVFLGDTGTAADDKEADRFCVWNDTQIIAAVPEGAKTGPIEVVNSAGLSDRTDDDFGNASLGNFTVDSSVRPGICTLSPAFGPVGTSVAVNGSGFGTSQGSSAVTVAGRSAAASNWTDQNLAFSVPALLGGTWPVVVTVNGIDSNPASFAIPVAGGGFPHLAAVEPDAASVGSYLTITGSNFGGSPGKIVFISGNDRILGGVDFPAACGTRYWRPDSVTIKVPPGLPNGAQKITLIRADSIESDNQLDFTQGSGSPQPGICAIVPATGPIGTAYAVAGERLGNDPGKIFFRQADGTLQISGWNDSKIGGAVPAAAITGRVYAASAAGSASNSLNFSVADCRKDAKACIGSEECCADGACRPPNADGSSGCSPAAKNGAYSYRFSTGAIPVTPAVAEDVTCASRTQSPTPWKSATDACINSVIGVRFTVPMDAASIGSSANFSLSPCGSGADFDPASCSGTVAGTLEAVGAAQTLDHGMQFTPGAPLTPGAWYQAAVKKAVLSAGGVPMNGDYVWHFRVRSSSEPCAIDSITVSPAQNRLLDIYDPASRDASENVSWSRYKANPASASCALLDCSKYSWSWTQSDPNKASIVPANVCGPEVQAVAETPAAQPDRIIAAAEGKAGRGDLVIQFPEPQVIGAWPNCQSACLEAQIAASFNTSMRGATVGPASAMLFKCANETCRTFVPVAASSRYEDSGNEHLAIIQPTGDLASDSFYRAVIVGGANGVLSAAGAQLAGTNYSYQGALAYSWVFRTSADHCTLSAISMTPPSVTTSVIGSYHAFTAVPQTASDACSPKGQRINPDTISWTWSAAPVPGAVSLFRDGALNAKPLASSTATSACLNAGSVYAKPVCGNRTVENGKGAAKAPGREAEGGGEECDLGPLNGAPGSGCSANCLLTGDGARSCGNGAVDRYALGDGATSVSEQCDLGAKNGTEGSGCSSKCLRTGSSAAVPPTVCGNGDVADNEQCDLGSANGSGSGCSADCLDEGSMAGNFPVCGNRMREPGEDCDPADGVFAASGGVGCSKACRFTGTPACASGTASGCCGNGLNESGEEPGCDLGWINGKPGVAEGCTSACVRAGSSMSYSVPSVCGADGRGVGETNDPGAAGTAIDATQYAQAVGQGNAIDSSGKMVSKVTATAGGKSASADFNLQCGYKSDAECARFGSLRLGANTCCYPPLSVVAVQPQPNAQAVCRNPAISVEFDRAVDEGSLVGNVTVAYPAPAGGCPKQAQGAANWRGILEKVSDFFKRAFSFLSGSAVSAAPGECAMPSSVTVESIASGGAVHAVVSVKLGAVLPASTAVSVRVGRTVKSAVGVPLGGDYVWGFATGTEVCTLDALRVSPASYLMSAQYSPGSSDPNAVKQFTATGVHVNPAGKDEPIAPIAGVYAWETGWGSSDQASPTRLIKAVAGGNLSDSWPTNSSSAVAGAASASNGQAVLTATAKITADKILSPSTVDATVQGKAKITLMMCLNPWPARAADGSWSPYAGTPSKGDNKYDLSFYYCRDGEKGGELLPALNSEPVVPANTLGLMNGGVDQFLFTFASGALPGEGVGIKVAPNIKHYKPSIWYFAQGFKGKTAGMTVDGYEAVKDSGTVYVNGPAVNPSGDGRSYTNIFALSVSAGAGAKTQNVYNQILKNFRFAASYDDANLCGGGKISCTTDMECPLGDCSAERSKLRRDVIRLSDLRLLGDSAFGKKQETGSYPALPSGSFLPGASVSAWPSWKGEFAKEIGGAPPSDPLNRFSSCNEDGYEKETCWSESKQKFYCPAGSHVYIYESNPSSGFFLASSSERPEFAAASMFCPYSDAKSCESDSLCYWSGRCRSRVSDPCATGFSASAGAPVCGNGIVEIGEICDSKSAYSDLDCGGGRTVKRTCSADCRTLSGSCAAAVCGDGVVESGEACDNGSLNGTYGHCNASCSGIGQNCGDGKLQQGESCDAGAGNGQYGSGCSADCHSQGEYCGDKKMNGPETCDGGNETSSAALSGTVDVSGASGACSVQGGYQTVRTRACTDSCGWGAWSACQMPGKCGDGAVQGTEQCDNGAANGATGSCTSECRKNVCGDGGIWSGREECDNGMHNINPATGASSDDPNALTNLRARCSLASCYYCTATCNVKAVSGPYCGDAVTQTGEQCDDGVAANIDPNDAGRLAAVAPGATYCTNACMRAVKPRCGDGNADSGEQCDLGPQNGVLNSGCSSSCRCAEEIFVSDGTTDLLNASGAVIGKATVLAQSFVNFFASCCWTSVPGAKHIWSFAEGVVPDPPDYNTVDDIEYFQTEFTLKHPTSRVVLTMTADNFIDWVKIDGKVIPGAAWNSFQTSTTVDLTSYIKDSWSQKHVVSFEARNEHQHWDNGSDSNPAMIAYSIVSTPNCAD